MPVHRYMRTIAWATWAALLLCTAGTVALMFSPVLLADVAPGWLVQALRDGWAPFCHQEPDRSFHVQGVALLACARCTSIFAGATLGVLLAPMAGLLDPRRMLPRWVLVASAAPMALDAGLAMLGLWEGNFVTRTMTGALAGLGAALFVMPGSVAAAAEILTALARAHGASSTIPHTEARTCRQE